VDPKVLVVWLVLEQLQVLLEHAAYQAP